MKKIQKKCWVISLIDSSVFRVRLLCKMMHVQSLKKVSLVISEKANLSDYFSVELIKFSEQ